MINVSKFGGIYSMFVNSQFDIYNFLRASKDSNISGRVYISHTFVIFNISLGFDK